MRSPPRLIALLPLLLACPTRQPPAAPSPALATVEPVEPGPSAAASADPADPATEAPTGPTTEPATEPATEPTTAPSPEPADPPPLADPSTDPPPEPAKKPPGKPSKKPHAEPTAATEPVTTPAPIAPDAPPIERFVGVFIYAGGEAQRKSALEAIDHALEDLDPITRSLARRRLAERDPVVPEITIAFADGKTTITRRDQAVTAPLGGPAVTVARDGRSARVTHRLSADTLLIESIRGEKGSTVNHFHLPGDGARLLVRTEINGDRLTSPIRYDLTYRRR